MHYHLVMFTCLPTQATDHCSVRYADAITCNLPAKGDPKRQATLCNKPWGSCCPRRLSERSCVSRTTQRLMKRRSDKTQTLRAGGTKNFDPLQTPFPGRGTAKI